MMMVVGGGILPLVQNAIADTMGYMFSYIIPLIAISVPMPLPGSPMPARRPAPAVRTNGSRLKKIGQVAYTLFAY